MVKVRLELVADFGPRRGNTFSGIVVEPEYDAILRAGLNKLKLKKKDDLCLIMRDRYRGSQLLDRNMDLSRLLRDGATIVLSTERPMVRFSKPPRWQWDDAVLDDDVLDRPMPVGSTGEEEIGTLAASHFPQLLDPTLPAVHALNHDGNTSCDKNPATLGDDMCRLASVETWPVFEGNVLPMIRQSIHGCEGFLEKDLGSYIAFDYFSRTAAELPTMFPDPFQAPRRSKAQLMASLRRECRGLLVCSTTGKVLARRLPKFFNVNEVLEAAIDSLPPGGLATEKLDGSLVSPLLLNDEIRWAGRSALVPDVEAFAANELAIKQVAELVRQGCTPIFEWCAAGPAVGVIGHQHSRLVLIGVRNMQTGGFWPYERMAGLGIDVVKRLNFEGLSTLCDDVRKMTGTEGVVVSWWNLGRMVKFKTMWWINLAAAQKRGGGQPAVALHAALQTLPLSSIPAPVIWKAALSAEDDLMSVIYGQLSPQAQTSMRAFVAAVNQGILSLHGELYEWAEGAQTASEADLARVAGGWPPSLLASYQRRSSLAEQHLRKCMMKMATPDRLLGLERMLGVAWKPGDEILEVCSHLGTFERAPTDVASHVIYSYLPRKISQYMSVAVSDDTCVRVEQLHVPSEGKLQGLWEQFVDVGIKDLRVDLQPRSKVFNFHTGDKDFAHWQVQFGPNSNCPRSSKFEEGDQSGAFAGVLFPTGTGVPFRDLRDAMKLSFETQKVVKINIKPTRISHIFLDLDGVLVDFEAGLSEAFGYVPDGKQKWQYIENTPGFYQHLPWMTGGSHLWEHIRDCGVGVTILTGVPEGHIGERSAVEKQEWVAHELGLVEVVTCLTRDKALHSRPGHLLIDDRPQTAWEVAGGRQIIHRSVSETLSALVELGLGHVFAAKRENVLILDTLTSELEAAAARAEVVALDAEWPPDIAGCSPHQAALLQLAFRPVQRFEVFIIDLISCDSRLKKFVEELLSSDLPKLIFGPADSDRLRMRVCNATDVQDDGLSLAAQAQRSGILLRKSKQLQAADWSERPLRDEQIIYAATDALVLFQVPGGKVARNTQAKATGGRNATVEFSAIFLTPESRQKLLHRMPPRLKEVTADHMTLNWKPASVKGLAVGNKVKIQVDGTACSEQVQAVSVHTLEAQPKSGHITISHRQDVGASEANNLAFNDTEPVTLEGIIGVQVMLGGVDPDTLPEKVMAKVATLMEGQPGQSVCFDSLTDGQRHALHLLSEQRGLLHRSEGKKGSDHRKMILTVPKRWKTPDVQADLQRTVVKDARKFAALLGDIPGLHLHGRITRKGIVWEPGMQLPPVLQRLAVNETLPAHESCSKFAIVLRGFPGSGKSTLATHLSKLLGAKVVSADDYWDGTENLQKAHEQCRSAFTEAIDAGLSVVVDNTNIRMSEYAYYIRVAGSAGHVLVTLEIVCDSTVELERLRRRSVHNPPGKIAGSMWGRWEQDSRAWRLAPFAPLQLMPWLHQHGMVGHRPHTHLVMPSGPFLSVPKAFEEEFFHRFSDEWGQHQISEQAQADAFRMFFDVDDLSLKDLLPALGVLHSLLDKDLVLTGTSETPPACHIFVKGTIVDVATALMWRSKWIAEVPWLDRHVDPQVYHGGKQGYVDGANCPHLRLVGSRKVSKCGLDLGRVHTVIGQFTGTWQAGAAWTWSEVTIRL